MTRAPQESQYDEAPEPWRIGEVLDGKFRIEEVLGRGGMGVVVGAHHLDLDEPVALKFLLPDATANRTAVERFLREARASAKLKSPHITRVFDVGRTADNTPYIVMERLRGEDLMSRMRSRPLSVAEAVRIVIEVCEPLEEAHAQGIIHRDLKPPNIFLARTGEKLIVKLLDFGISRVVMAENALTAANEFLGTPHFMAPEQYRDPRSASPRSDIYSLGACLYMMLTQRPPFFGGDLVGLSMRILGEPHVPVRERRDDVPEALAAVIDRCLAKTPEDRFASVRALRSALEPFAGEVPSAHLDDDTILAMQEGRLAGTKLAAVEAHVSACEACMALVAIAGPSQARSHAPPLLGMHDATVTGHRLATTVNDDLAPTIATPRGASARAMATLISGENSTVSGEIAASSTHSVGGVAAAIPRGSTLASGPMAVPVAPPPKPPALVALAGMLVIALVGVGGVVILKRPSPPVAVAAPPPTTAEPVPTATETPVEAALPLPLPTPSIAPSTTTAAKKPPAPRPKHAAPTPKVGEIPNER